MGKREDYIKDILSGYETPVDIPSSWNELEKLLEEPEKKRKPIWYWFSLIGVFLSILLVAYFLNIYTNSTDAPIAKLENQSSDIAEDIAANAQIHEEGFTSSNIDSYEIDESKLKRYNDLKNVKQNNKQTSSNPNNKYKGNENSNFSKNSAVVNTITNQGTEVMVVDSDESTYKSDIKNKTSFDDWSVYIDASTMETRSSLGTIGRLPQLAFSLIKENNIASKIFIPTYANLTPSELEEDRIIIPVKSNSGFLVTVEGGALRHSLNYKIGDDAVFNGASLLADEFGGLRTFGEAANVEFLTGYNVGSSLSYSFNNGLVLKSGLNFHNFSSKVEGEYNNREIAIDPNGFVLFNNSQGEVVASLGVEMSQIADQRKIIHYNNISNWKIPVQIGWSVNRNKTQIIASMGAGLNMITSASGRYFSDSLSVQAINSEAPYKQNSLLYSLGAELELHRNIGKNLNLFAGLKAGTFLSDISANEFTNTNFNYLALNLGVSHNF